MGSARPSEKQVAQALSDNAALEKIQRLKPSWDDLKSELGVTPTVRPDGTYEANVRGHDKVVRMLKMYDKAHQAAGERGLELQTRVSRVPLRCNDGRVREVAEAHADRVGRKFNARVATKPSRHRTVWAYDHDSGEVVVVRPGLA